MLDRPNPVAFLLVDGRYTMNPNIIPGTIETYYQTSVKSDVHSLIKTLQSDFPTSDDAMSTDGHGGMAVIITCYLIDNARQIMSVIDGHKGSNGTSFFLNQYKGPDDGLNDSDTRHPSPPPSVQTTSYSTSV